jgi:hypothetical protein
MDANYNQIVSAMKENYINSNYIKRLVNNELSSKEYTVYLLSLCEIVGTIERGYGLPHSSFFVEDKILDELAFMGIEELGSYGICTKKYCEYLRTLDYDTIIPHIIVNYGFIIHELKNFGFSKRLSSESKVNLDEIINNHTNSEFAIDMAEEANHAYGWLNSIADELEFIK